MNKNNLLKTAFIIGILLLVVGDVVAQATNVVGRINCVVCRVAQLLILIVSVIAGIIILMAGVKWVGSPDDPAARGAARLTIIHTFIGIIIVIIALYLVQWVTTGLLTPTGVGVTQPNPVDWITGACTGCS